VPRSSKTVTAAAAVPGRVLEAGWRSLRRAAGPRGPRVLLVSAAYALLSVVFTWPLASAPARVGVRNGDYFAFTWALAALVRQAFHDPLHLFDSNLFWPHQQTLAYHDILLSEGLTAAPVFALGGGPLLAHNLALLLTFPLAGLGAYLLAYDLTRSRLGAFVAGLTFAFSGHRVMHLIQIPVLSSQWLPLVLFFFLRCLRRPTRARILGLLAMVVLQALSSGYYAAILVVVLGLTCAFYARALLRHGRWRGVGLALVAAALVIATASLPYRALKQREGLERSREICLFYSAQASSYVRPAQPGVLPHVRWLSEHVPDHEPLFVGLTSLALAALGVVAAGRRRWFALLLTGSAVLLSFGPEVVVGWWRVPGPYELFRLLPFARMMRDPSRFGAVATLGLGLLAAWGTAVVTRKLGRVGSHAGLALAALVFMELYPGQSAFRPLRPPPPVAGWLASAPRGPVLELPWDVSHLPDGAEYMYWSTVHWQPMINGAGAFLAPSNINVGMVGRGFPDEDVVAVLRGVGVRYVVVHRHRLPWQRARRFRAASLPEGVDVVRRPDFGDAAVFVIRPSGRRSVPPWIPDDWRAVLSAMEPQADVEAEERPETTPSER
jgi:hypothetical protein